MASISQMLSCSIFGRDGPRGTIGEDREGQNALVNSDETQPPSQPLDHAIITHGHLMQRVIQVQGRFFPWRVYGLAITTYLVKSLKVSKVTIGLLTDVGGRLHITSKPFGGMHSEIDIDGQLSMHLLSRKHIERKGKIVLKIWCVK